MRVTIKRRKAVQDASLSSRIVGAFRGNSVFVLLNDESEEIGRILKGKCGSKSLHLQIEVSAGAFEIVESQGILRLMQSDAEIIGGLSKRRLERGGSAEFSFSGHSYMLSLESFRMDTYALNCETIKVASLKRRLRQWTIDTRENLEDELLAFCFVLARIMSSADGE